MSRPFQRPQVITISARLHLKNVFIPPVKCVKDFYRNVFRIINDAFEKDARGTGRNAQEFRVLAGEDDGSKGLDGSMEINMKLLGQEVIQRAGEPHLQDLFVFPVREVASLDDQGDTVSETEAFGQDNKLFLSQHQFFTHLRGSLDHGFSDEFGLGLNPHPDHIVSEAGDMLEGIFHRLEGFPDDKGTYPVLLEHQAFGYQIRNGLANRVPIDVEMLGKPRFRRQLIVDAVPAFLDHFQQPVANLEIFGNP